MFDQIGPVLRLLRERQGRAQAEVARAAGLANSALSRYESQALVPSLANLGKILVALDVDLAHLGAALDAADGRPPGEQHAAPLTPTGTGNSTAAEGPSLVQLLGSAMSDLSPESRQALADGLDAFERLSHSLRRGSGPPGDQGEA